MPNHVTHRLTCTGDRAVLDYLIQAVSRKEETRSKDDPGAAFDFTKIIPQPPLLFQENVGVEEKRAHPNRNWYEWNWSRWGTKWNCYRTCVERSSPEEADIYFDTAWSVPEPVLTELSFLFPEIEFAIRFIDECWNFGGIQQYCSGNIVYEQDVPCDSSNPKFGVLYEELFGEPLPTDEKDEEPEAVKAFNEDEENEL